MGKGVHLPSCFNFHFKGLRIACLLRCLHRLVRCNLLTDFGSCKAFGYLQPWSRAGLMLQTLEVLGADAGILALTHDAQLHYALTRRPGHQLAKNLCVGP